MDIPEDVRHLSYLAERFSELERESQIRLRGDADEWLVGAVLFFPVSFFAIERTIGYLAFAGLIYFFIEWLEVRRLRREKYRIFTMFEQKGYFIFASGTGEVSFHRVCSPEEFR